MTERAMHVLVSGHVQGVAFRWTTRDRARELALSGWVRNLRDGRVEVLAAGEAGALEELWAWLADGPVHARVDERVRSEREVRGLGEFDVAPTALGPLA